jgi:outer membrane protein assembly factor BamB
MPREGNPAPRRTALLGGAATLLAGGCETVSGWFEERKTPLPGERRSVLAAGGERGLAVDAEAGGAAAAPVTLPPPQPRADWPQVGGGPAHAPGHPALGPALAEAWRASFGTGSGYRRRMTAPPVVGGGPGGNSVYAVDAYGILSAFDAATGGRRWRLDTSPEKESDGAMGGGAALAPDGGDGGGAGTLYVATGLAEVLAVDPASGTVRWRTRLPAPARGAPTVAGGRVFVPTIENQLLALAAAEEGRRLWTHRASPTSAAPLGLPPPAVEGETVVAGFASGELTALRAADGRVLWSETLAAGGSRSIAEISGIRAPPVVDRGRVFAIDLGGLLIAIDLRSGRRLWEREVAGSEMPWAAGDWLFVLSTDADLAAIGRDDGRVRWVTSLRPQRQPGGRREPEPVSWAAPVLAGGRLILAGGGGEAAFVDPATGAVTGRQRLPGGGATLQPAVAENTLYLATDDATLVALRGAG